MFGTPQRARDTNCCFHEHQEWVGVVAPANRLLELKPAIIFTASRGRQVQLCRLNLEKSVCMIKMTDSKLMQATQHAPNYNIMQFIIVCFSPQLGRPWPSWSQSPQWRLYWSCRCASVFGNVSCGKKVSLAIFPMVLCQNWNSRRKTKLHNHMLLCRDRYDKAPSRPFLHFLSAFIDGRVAKPNSLCVTLLWKSGFCWLLSTICLVPHMINSSWNISS